MEDKKITTKDKPLVNNSKFTKKVILTFDKYSKRKDLLQVLLKDNKSYTIEEVDKIINDFMGGK